MSVQNEAMCLNCGHRWMSKWKAKWKPDDMPYGVQCPRCMKYSIILVKQYEAHLQHWKKLLTPAEMKRFLDFYNFAVDHGYMKNAASRELKFRKLMEDLATE